MSKQVKINIPKGVTERQVITDITEGSKVAIIALPEVLSTIAEILEDMNSKLDTLALYFERKGVSEHLISEEDLGTAENETGEHDEH